MTPPRAGAVWVLALAVAAGGCGDPHAPTQVGVVVAVDGELDDVSGFELVTGDGERLRFEIEPGGDFHGLGLGHLGEHLRTAVPIRVEYEEREGALVVVGLEDAG